MNVIYTVLQAKQLLLMNYIQNAQGQTHLRDSQLYLSCVSSLYLNSLAKCCDLQ